MINLAHRRGVAALLLGVSGVALSSPVLAQAAPQAAPTPVTSSVAEQTGDIVVTANRREQSIQSVPIAVTAIGGSAMAAQQVNNGGNLASVVPNLTFQPGGGQPNFSIRGIGFQIFTSAAESGVAIHVNEAPLAVSRLAQAEFFDMERIEVLRGPQGTLFGRNSTGGVINIITNKARLHDFSGSITAGYGNYNAKKTNGYINIPVTDTLAVRAAGSFLKRDGFSRNVIDGSRVYGKDLWSTRLSATWNPTPGVRTSFMWEHFRENDSDPVGANVGTACLRDPGPASVGGTNLTANTTQNAVIRNNLSYGCTIGSPASASIYNPSVLSDTANGVGSFINRLSNLYGVTTGDIFAGSPAKGPFLTNLSLKPVNSIKNDVIQGNIAVDLSDRLTLATLINYTRDYAVTVTPSARSTNPLPGVAPFIDPNLQPGAAQNYSIAATGGRALDKEFTAEVRLSSNKSGPVSFTFGALYGKIDRSNYGFSMASNYWLLSQSGAFGYAIADDPRTIAGGADGGHRYFESVSPYRLRSAAAFGEVTWRVTEELNLVAGLRFSHDEKFFDNNNSAGQLLLPGFGYTFSDTAKLTYNKPTGRVILNWSPKLGFTDSTLIYASFSRGFKAGGFNPPNLNFTPPPFKGETVNAYEIGIKNDLLGRKAQLNASAFYYDYKNYQFSQALAYATITNNVNARIYGLELEGRLRPVRALELNANVGLLHATLLRSASSSSIDVYNPTAGNSNYFPLRDFFGSVCMANPAALGRFLAAVQNDPSLNTYVIGYGGNSLCSQTPGSPGAVMASQYNLFQGVPADQFKGVTQNFGGNRLPNIPNITANFGAQYTFQIGSDWSLVPRGDLRYTGNLYTDLFNNIDQRVKAYFAGNASLSLTNSKAKLTVQGFVKNIAKANTFIGASVSGGPVLGSYRSVTYLDPTTYGFTITKSW